MDIFKILMVDAINALLITVKIAQMEILAQFVKINII